MLTTRAYIFLFLNAVRALSIAALLLVFASSIVTMVHDIQAVNHFISDGKVSSSVLASAGAANTTADDDLLNSDYISGSTVPNQPAGAFWAVLNRLLIIGQVLVLLLSELAWPARFFARFFPVLGNDFGLGALGVIQCLLGAAILSHHVDTFALVAAFFLFALGCLNALLGLIWRERAKPKLALAAWRDAAPPPSELPTHVRTPAYPDSRLARTLSARSDTEKADVGAVAAGQVPANRAGLGFGRQGEKAAALKDFITSTPSESLPSYAAKPTSA
jgi:hypothetical protein